MIPARAIASAIEPERFRPEFFQHRGYRVLRLDYTGLDPTDLAAAFLEARDVMAHEPAGSVRVLTIFNSRFDANAIEVLRRCLVSNRPHVRASAVLAGGFWRVIVTSIKLHERHDLCLFDAEEDALDWLAR